MFVIRVIALLSLSLASASVGGQWLGHTSQPGQPGQPGQTGPGGRAAPGDPCLPRTPDVVVKPLTATYAAAAPFTPTGFVTAGQAADLLLSGVDFDNAGGGLLFNHPGGIGTDGTRLLVADRNNNRVLIWLAAPGANTPPDLVLGQPDFVHNDPGTGLDRMNWPSAASTKDGKLVVADTENNRILVWRTFPARSGTAADFAIDLHRVSAALHKGNFEWPWGVWTDGTRLVATSTHATPAIIIWNHFPADAGALPDITLMNTGIGTPRQITSDGTNLIVWDHNAKEGTEMFRGTFFWRAFPTTNDQPFDYLARFQAVGDFTSDGKLVTAGSGLRVYSSLPVSATSRPDLEIQDGVGSQDGVGVALAGGRVYELDGNGNRLVVYNALPTQASARPDFAVGAPDLCTNTLTQHFIMSNPIPATDGESLFVSSDFDAKLYVYDKLPDSPNAHPDWVYYLPEGGWDNALFGNTLVLAGRMSVLIWSRLPKSGEMPSAIFQGGIGRTRFTQLAGAALDDNYLYLADGGAGKIYGWRGIPTATSEPAFTLDVGPAIGRLDSDGQHLVAVQNNRALIWEVAALQDGAVPQEVKGAANQRPGPEPAPADYWRFNLPGGALIAGDRLLVADTGFGRVLGWEHWQDAVDGMAPTVILGAKDLADMSQEIGRDKLFFPAGLALGGGYLWVGEFKFSERLLRYDLPGRAPSGGVPTATRTMVPGDEPWPTPAAPPSGRRLVFLPLMWR